MPDVIFIRHSISAVDPARPPHEWGLTDEGRRRCIPLAERLAVYHPQVVVASVEPKAALTGQLVAEQLGLPFETAPGLHEHVRPVTRWMERAAFQAAVAALFQKPDELVMGAETATQARQRFTEAVQATLARYPGQSVAIATHGTVMSLFIAQACGIAPFPFWQVLGMPAFAALSLPELALLDVVNEVEP